MVILCKYDWNCCFYHHRLQGIWSSVNIDVLDGEKFLSILASTQLKPLEAIIGSPHTTSLAVENGFPTYFLLTSLYYNSVQKRHFSAIPGVLERCISVFYETCINMVFGCTDFLQKLLPNQRKVVCCVTFLPRQSAGNWWTITDFSLGEDPVGIQLWYFGYRLCSPQGNHNWFLRCEILTKNSNFGRFMHFFMYFCISFRKRL